MGYDFLVFLVGAKRKVEIGGTEERQTEISVKVPCKWVKWPNISPEMGISDKPSHESE